MIFRGLCGTIYQGLRGLCTYGLLNLRPAARICLSKTPTVLSKRSRSLSRQRNVVKNYGVFSFKKPGDPVQTQRNKQTEWTNCVSTVAFEPTDPMRSENKTTESLHSVAVEPIDPMWSQNKRTESLNSVAVEPIAPMWPQNKTIESLRSVAVERTTERWYTANEALHNRSTNLEFGEKYGEYNNDVVSTRKSRESRQAAKYSRKREREPSRIPVKKLLNAMRIKMRRRKIRSYVRGFIPRSSGLHDISQRYKYWRLWYLGDKLDTQYAACMKCVRRPKRHRRCPWQASLDAVFSTQKYKHITLRGGMLSCNLRQDLPMQCLSERLSHLGLKPLDVGGSGDCFFKAVSHQLYQTPTLHARVWMAGIDHLNTHSELFRKYVITRPRPKRPGAES